MEAGCSQLNKQMDIGLIKFIMMSVVQLLGNWIRRHRKGK